MPLPPVTVYAVAYDRVLDGEAVTVSAERDRLSGWVTWRVNDRQIRISSMGGIESMK